MATGAEHVATPETPETPETTNRGHSAAPENIDSSGGTCELDAGEGSKVSRRTVSCRCWVSSFEDNNAAFAFCNHYRAVSLESPHFGLRDRPMAKYRHAHSMINASVVNDTQCFILVDTTKER